MKLTARVVLCALIAAPGAAAPRITLHAQSEPLSEFVADVSRQAKVKLILAKDLAQEKISARMTRVTLNDVIDVLKNFKGVAVRKIEGGYSLTRELRRS